MFWSDLMAGSYWELLNDVIDRELGWVGKEDVRDTPDFAMYAENVRRVQVWTLEWLADSLKPDDPMADMFRQLADGVRHIPDYDLWSGRPGSVDSHMFGEPVVPLGQEERP